MHEWPYDRGKVPSFLKYFKVGSPVAAATMPRSETKLADIQGKSSANPRYDQLHRQRIEHRERVDFGVGALGRVGGAAAHRWVIAIQKRNQLPTTLPITSVLSSWHYQLK